MDAGPWFSAGADMFIALRRQMDAGHIIGEEDVSRVLDALLTQLLSEDTIAIVQSPVVIVGDVHGQYEDVRFLFQKALHPTLPSDSPDSPTDLNGLNFLFMGDYVDRGHYSLNTFLLIVSYKLQAPGTVTMLRGNHESRQVTQQYGFHQEIISKYGHAGIWIKCMQIFDLLPFAAITDNKIFSIHGGLSPDMKLLDQINKADRREEIPSMGLFCDLAWSDPDEGGNVTFRPNPRGAGQIFGRLPVQEFLRVNKLQLITRSHQLVQDGFQWFFCNKSGTDGKLINVWSAPNYSYSSGNDASILMFKSSGNEYDLVKFREATNRIQTKDIRPDPRYFA
jgi:diadenosine tetraphosphatase ApaH/serine/threonine PP2A family protein phosphatase